MNEWLKQNLVCPRDYSRLSLDGDSLTCEMAHTYPYVGGIPVMLIEETIPTQQKEFSESLEKAKDIGEHVSSEEKQAGRGQIDPYVQEVIGATCGIMYEHLIDKLDEYPIPDLRLPNSSGQHFLDIGCNWGRWCISAARKGYNPIGIDHNLDALFAARRVADQLGIEAAYVVADARYLPFVSDSLDVVFSYSVLQHFAKEDVRSSLSQVARVLKPSGFCFIQMPNTFGLRSLYHQFKRGLRKAEAFEVRYWSPSELEKTFSSLIGPTSLSVDGYFSVNAQTADIGQLRAVHKMAVLFSNRLRSLSEKIGPMKLFADSLYVKSTYTTDGAN